MVTWYNAVQSASGVFINKIEDGPKKTPLYNIYHYMWPSKYADKLSWYWEKYS